MSATTTDLRLTRTSVHMQLHRRRHFSEPLGNCVQTYAPEWLCLLWPLKMATTSSGGGLATGSDGHETDCGRVLGPGGDGTRTPGWLANKPFSSKRRDAAGRGWPVSASFYRASCLPRSAPFCKQFPGGRQRDTAAGTGVSRAHTQDACSAGPARQVVLLSTRGGGELAARAHSRQVAAARGKAISARTRCGRARAAPSDWA
jgi:hypothetical protein